MHSNEGRGASRKIGAGRGMRGCGEVSNASAGGANHETGRVERPKPQETERIPKGGGIQKL